MVRMQVGQQYSVNLAKFQSGLPQPLGGSSTTVNEQVFSACLYEDTRPKTIHGWGGTSRPQQGDAKFIRGKRLSRGC